MASGGPPGVENGEPKPSSRWYSGRGDDGTTGLLGPGRVPKFDLRPATCGAVDEAQAAIGLARAAGCAPDVCSVLLAVQADLSALMAELAAAGTEDGQFPAQISAAHITQLETWLAGVEAAIDPPRTFVLPGSTLPGAALHLARAVVRRAEREAVRLLDSGLLSNPHVLRYLNRLSSLLFLLACAEDARFANRASMPGNP